MNVEAATARYIDGLGAANLEKAAAYTSGGHWILLWNLVVAAIVTWLVVRSDLLERVEDVIFNRRADATEAGGARLSRPRGLRVDLDQRIEDHLQGVGWWQRQVRRQV